MVRVKDVVGRYGEELAAAHLVSSGLRVVERNWRCGEGEIDIVAWDGPCLVFCEVKTRTGLGFGAPVEAVTPAKAHRLRALASRWLADRRPPGSPPLRFDVVGVLCARGRGPEVQHLRGAF
jgi:putative endonuclease